MSQKMDSQLQYVFNDWGKSPPPLAWETIKSKRLERENAEKENRKRFLLVFFTGNVAMALVLLPFFIFRNSEHNVEPAVRIEGIQRLNAEPSKLPNASVILKSEPEIINPVQLSKYTLIKSTKLTNGCSESDLFVASSVEDLSETGLCELSAIDRFKFNFLLPEFTSKKNEKLNLPIEKASKIMFGLTAGYIYEKVGKVDVNNQEDIHKDAQPFYTNWLSGPSNGFNIQASMRTILGARWQFSAGLNYSFLAQAQKIDYTYNQVPVTQNGNIVGYFTLADSLSTRYNYTNQTRSSCLSLSLQLGHPIWKGRRFSVSGSVMVFPKLISGTRGQLPDIDRNSLRNLRQAVRTKGVPVGFGLTFVRQIQKNLFFQINYQLIYTQNSVQMSGARIVSKGFSNALTLGILVPVTFSNKNQASTKKID